MNGLCDGKNKTKVIPPIIYNILKPSSWSIGWSLLHVGKSVSSFIRVQILLLAMDLVKNPSL